MKILNCGKVSFYEVPLGLSLQCRGMPNNLTDYFDLSDHHRLARLDDMILSRIRPEGVSAALIRMRDAAFGTGKKRKPILVRKEGPSYLILDGNSTTIVLAALGISIAPITITDKLRDLDLDA